MDKRLTYRDKTYADHKHIVIDAYASDQGFHGPLKMQPTEEVGDAIVFLDKTRAAAIDGAQIREQKLIDLCFSLTIMAANPQMGRDGKWLNLTRKGTAWTAEWVAEQLRSNGFDTEPQGASHGVLKRGDLM